MGPAMAARVSESPPREMALRTASSKLSDSRALVMAFGHGGLADLVELVARSDVVDGAGEVVVVGIGDG